MIGRAGGIAAAECISPTADLVPDNRGGAHQQGPVEQLVPEIVLGKLIEQLQRPLVDLLAATRPG